jgi:hypothetical protein
LRPEYGYKQVIAEMWRASDLIECLIFLALALMLLRALFVTARFFLRYFLLRREPFGTTGSIPRSHGAKNLFAELGRGVGTLRTIAAYAPFLGLAGAGYGILCLFARGIVGWRWPVVLMIELALPAALVATAAGLITATTAAVCYNVLCTYLEKIETKHAGARPKAAPRCYGFAQTLPLRKQFAGMPAFALIGAPVLAILIPIFITSFGPPTPVGLPIHLLKIGRSNDEPAPIVISLIDAGPANDPKVYVNSKETPWDELHDALRQELNLRPHWIVYVEAGDDVRWMYVEYAIDVARGLHAEVVLLSAKPTVSGNSPKNKNRTKK